MYVQSRAYLPGKQMNRIFLHHHGMNHVNQHLICNTLPNYSIDIIQVVVSYYDTSFQTVLGSS